MGNLIENKDIFTNEPNLLASTGDLLDQVEADISKMSQGIPIYAPDILSRLDEIYRRLLEAKKEHRNPKAEQAQFEYIQSLLKKHVRLFIHEMGGAAKFQDLRTERQPDPTFSWWYLDLWVGNQQKKLIQKTGMQIGAAIIIILMLGVIYQFFLAPDPASQAVYEHQNLAEQYIAANKPESALVEIDLALKSKPQDLELLIMKGVLLEQMGQAEQARYAFSSAQKIAVSSQQFLLTRSEKYLYAGKAEKSAEDASQVISQDPNSAEGFYYLGKANEALGDSEKALNAYQKASELAEKQNRSELVATIRINMAMLIQAAPGKSLNQNLEATPVK